MDKETMRKLCVDQREYYRRTLVNQIANPYYSHDLYDIFSNQIKMLDGSNAWLKVTKVPGTGRIILD